MPHHQELSHSSPATFMHANLMAALDSQIIQRLTLVFLLYGLTFSELDLMHEEERVKIWIPLRPLKVSGVLRFPILTFIVVWRLMQV